MLNFTSLSFLYTCRHKEAGRIRLLMRQEKTMKVCVEECLYICMYVKVTLSSLHTLTNLPFPPPPPQHVGDCQPHGRPAYRDAAQCGFGPFVGVDSVRLRRRRLEGGGLCAQVWQAPGCRGVQEGL